MAKKSVFKGEKLEIEAEGAAKLLAMALIISGAFLTIQRYVIWGKPRFLGAIRL